MASSPKACTSYLTELTSRPLSKFCLSVPLRLNLRERILLTTLESTLSVSEYTDIVDVVSRRNKSQRIVDAILEAVSIAIGLGMCGAGESGRTSLNKEMTVAASNDPADSEKLLCEIFEVGRRNKILNPAKVSRTLNVRCEARSRPVFRPLFRRMPLPPRCAPLCSHSCVGAAHTVSVR